ncbi:MAG: glutathione S-transferase family protein, partial [Actinobacteria bacterium]|nr:glutathione S-transferase family protein [Actinomycetota bacterium]
MRLVLNEYNISVELIEERVNDRRSAFLALDPGGR